MTPFQAFRNHKRGAKQRGIDFHFTFETWCKWWEDNLGDDWFNQRGRCGHNYVMGRKRDLGPYKIGNVICITASQNIADREQRATLKRQSKPMINGKRQYSKIDAKIAKDIYLMKGTQRSIAVRYDVSERLVRMIKNKQLWIDAINAGGNS